MIETIIQYYTNIIGAMPYFSNVYGLVELKESSGITRPVQRVGKKMWPVKLNTTGTSYFRKRSDVTIDESVSQVSCNVLYSFTIPLRLIAIVKRANFPMDNEFSADKLAATLIKGLTFKNGDLKKQIGAVSVVGSAKLYSTDTQQIMKDELTGFDSRSDFNHDDIIVGINIDLTITTYKRCIIDPCDYLPRFCLQLESYVALP